MPPSPSLQWVHAAAGLSRRFRTWLDKACKNYEELLELEGVVDNRLRRERREELTGAERTAFTEALMEYDKLVDGLAKFAKLKSFEDFVSFTGENLIKWVGDEIVSLGYCGFRERSSQYWLWDYRAEKLPYEKNLRQVFEFYGLDTRIYGLSVPSQEQAEAWLFEFLENIKKWPRSHIEWLMRNFYPLSHDTGGFWVVTRKVMELESLRDAWEDKISDWKRDVEGALKRTPEFEVLKAILASEWDTEKYLRSLAEDVENEFLDKYGMTTADIEKVKDEFYDRAMELLKERVAPEGQIREVYEQLLPLVPADKVERTKAGLLKAIRWLFLHPTMDFDAFVSAHVFPLDFTTEEARAIGLKIAEKVTKKLLYPPAPPPAVPVVAPPTPSPIEVKWKKAICPKDAICEVVEMSPLDFLAKVPSPCREGRTALEDLNITDCWSQSSIDYIMEQVKKGVELDPPMLDYTRMFRGFPTHEGRHTAFVAHKLDVKKVPILVFGKPPVPPVVPEKVSREEFYRVYDEALFEWIPHAIEASKPGLSGRLYYEAREFEAETLAKFSMDTVLSKWENVIAKEKEEQYRRYVEAKTPEHAKRHLADVPELARNLAISLVDKTEKQLFEEAKAKARIPPPELPIGEIERLRTVVRVTADELGLEFSPEVWERFWREYEARAKELWATEKVSFKEGEVRDVLRAVAPPPKPPARPPVEISVEAPPEIFIEPTAPPKEPISPLGFPRSPTSDERERLWRAFMYEMSRIGQDPYRWREAFRMHVLDRPYRFWGDLLSNFREFVEAVETGREYRFIALATVPMPWRPEEKPEERKEDAITHFIATKLYPSMDELIYALRAYGVEATEQQIKEVAKKAWKEKNVWFTSVPKEFIESLIGEKLED